MHNNSKNSALWQICLLGLLSFACSETSLTSGGDVRSQQTSQTNGTSRGASGSANGPSEDATGQQDDDAGMEGGSSASANRTGANTGVNNGNVSDDEGGSVGQTMPDLSYLPTGGTTGTAAVSELETGEYKICTFNKNQGLNFVNDSGLAVQSGYAANDGKATLTLPSYVIDAKGYINRVMQDDTGGRLSVGGEVVMLFKYGTNGAANWTFNGQNTPVSFDPPNAHKVAEWVASIGGIGNAMTTMRQGFPLKAGDNVISGNAADIYGSIRSLSVEFQVRAVIPKGKDCPQ